MVDVNLVSLYFCQQSVWTAQPQMVEHLDFYFFFLFWIIPLKCYRETILMSWLRRSDNPGYRSHITLKILLQSCDGLFSVSLLWLLPLSNVGSRAYIYKQHISTLKIPSVSILMKEIEDRFSKTFPFSCLFWYFLKHWQIAFCAAKNTVL